MHSESASYFLPPERLDSRRLASSIREVCAHPLVTQLMKSFKAAVLVLNDHRQIVAANDDAADLLAGGDAAVILGLRPGESIGCVHATNPTGGCGTQPACRSCGAVGAVLESRRLNAAARRECSISIRRADGIPASAVLEVHAAPLPLGADVFTLVTVLDILEEKRRENLERTFFHDIINTVGGLGGLCQLIEENGGVDSSLMEAARHTADYLAESVYSQRDLLAMEDGRYESERRAVRPEDVLRRVETLLGMNAAWRTNRLQVENLAPGVEISTDVTLLVRVLVNMVKNGFEAVASGEPVRVTFSKHDHEVCFEVANDGDIPETVVHRIFEKHYSTKGGVGRGIGTFSMKLLGEYYLGGKIGFKTGDGRTTFFIDLPLDSK